MTLTLDVDRGREGAFSTIQEALDALEEMAPIPEEIRRELAKGKRYPAPDLDVTPAVIRIAPGSYREKLVISRPKVTLEGWRASGETVLVYGQGAFEMLGDGTRRGTFRTASVRIDAPDFTARNLTFQNDAGCGHTVGQALALYVDADRCFFENCKILGSQDTLFTAPLPLREMQPGGFRGPGEHLPRIRGRHYYKDCLIQGDVDFIFGGGICYFENCTLFSKRPEDQTEQGAQDGAGGRVCGYVTAASTPQDQEYGYVFQSCRLTGDCPEGSVYLGRPWREYARTVFLNCEMGAHIHPQGWTDWEKDHAHFFYAEYASYGPGASPGTRAAFSRQLTEEEAAHYGREEVLAGWIPGKKTVSDTK